jgi:GGDEF domain-containing protein
VQSRIDELSGKERTLPQMLHLADLVARLMDQPYGSALGELLAAGGNYCGLNYEKLQPIVADLQSKVAELAEVLCLELPDGQSYVDLLIAAQQRLANETVDAMAAMATSQADGEMTALAAELQQRLFAASEVTALAAGRSSACRPPVEMHSHNECISRHEGAHFRGGREVKRLSNDQVLKAPLAAAIQRSRQSRSPLTLALFEMDNFSDLLMQAGPAAMTELAYALRYALADWTASTAEARLVSDSRMAMVWENCSRSEALGRARDSLCAVGDWSREQFELSVDITLSVGVATLEVAPKNYPPQELIDAAERCLSGAQLSGGNSVKSIAF